MNPVEVLTTASGIWRGTKTPQGSNTGKPEASPSMATVTSVQGGQFFRLDYTWGFQGKPQGSLSIGFDSGEGSGHWIDAWHMGRRP